MTSLHVTPNNRTLTFLHSCALRATIRDAESLKTNTHTVSNPLRLENSEDAETEFKEKTEVLSKEPFLEY